MGVKTQQYVCIYYIIRQPTCLMWHITLLNQACTLVSHAVYKLMVLYSITCK